MPAYDNQALLANAVNVAAVGRGTVVNTTPGSDMEGVPGGRAMQALVTFSGTINAASMVLVIEEQVLSVAPATYVYRPVGIMHIGATPVASGTWQTSGDLWTSDPNASFASNAGMFHRMIFQAGPGRTSETPRVGQVTGMCYNVIQLGAGGNNNGMTIAVMPFEGPVAPIGNPA